MQDNGINAELGLAASEDAILDTLAEKAEKEIVSGGSSEKNLIGECAPFLSKLCKNFSLMKKVYALAFSAPFASFFPLPTPTTPTLTQRKGDGLSVICVPIRSVLMINDIMIT